MYREWSDASTSSPFCPGCCQDRLLLGSFSVLANILFCLIMLTLYHHKTDGSSMAVVVSRQQLSAPFNIF